MGVHAHVFQGGSTHKNWEGRESKSSSRHEPFSFAVHSSAGQHATHSFPGQNADQRFSTSPPRGPPLSGPSLPSRSEPVPSDLAESKGGFGRAEAQQMAQAGQRGRSVSGGRDSEQLPTPIQSTDTFGSRWSFKGGQRERGKTRNDAPGHASLQVCAQPS